MAAAGRTDQAVSPLRPARTRVCPSNVDRLASLAARLPIGSESESVSVIGGRVASQPVIGGTAACRLPAPLSTNST